MRLSEIPNLSSSFTFSQITLPWSLVFSVCICTLSYPPFQLVHKQLFHSLAPLQASPEIGTVTTTNAWPAGGGLCRVHCGLLPFPHIMDPSYGSIVLKIQPLLLRTWTFHVPLYHKHCSWVFLLSSCSASHPPKCRILIILQVIVLIGRENITPCQDVEAGEWRVY